MDRKQQAILAGHGYIFEEVVGLHPQPRATFYSRDANTGAVVKHDLPADAYSLDHYLKKGFVLDPSALKPLAVEAQLEGAEVAAKRHYRNTKTKIRRNK